MNVPIGHNLKISTEMFNAIIGLGKNFECRKNDRNFKIGDQLCLREYDQKTDEYSGSYLLASVEYILHGGNFGIAKDHCVMSINVHNVKIRADENEIQKSSIDYSVEIKPLAWSEIEDTFDLLAFSVVGTYLIEDQGSETKNNRWWIILNGRVLGKTDDKEAAINLADSDFKKRIFSVINPKF